MKSNQSPNQNGSLGSARSFSIGAGWLAKCFIAGLLAVIAVGAVPLAIWSIGYITDTQRGSVAPLEDQDPLAFLKYLGLVLWWLLWLRHQLMAPDVPEFR